MSDDHGHKEEVVTETLPGGLTREQLLVMYGFVKDGHKQEYNEKIAIYKSEMKRRAQVKQISPSKAKEMADQERCEIVDETFGETGYPGGGVRFHLILESSTDGVEDSYFDVMEKMKQMHGFATIYKVSDYFAASENSAFFGNSQQRLGIQQDRVQQFLANIGKFVKELFQMVRELRILDERLAIYEAAGGLPDADKKEREDHGHSNHGHNGHGHSKEEKKHSHAADVTLKSIFTDLVEGGTKNPQSVFGLASQVNFTLLPDLFFNEYVATSKEVDKRVDAMQYNNSLKAVLKRKLFQYLVWKEKTYFELKHRRSFNLKYLRQHWSIIQLYMAWVKPYLRNIQRLTMHQQFFDSPDVLAAFETSYIEAEFIGVKPPIAGHHPVIMGTFLFRGRPDMSVRKEYQTGPVHMGRMDMTLRAYSWTPEQVKAYRDMKRREEIELLGYLDSSLTDIMQALGEDFEHYLKQAGEEIVKEEEPKHPKKAEDGALAPVIALAGGFKDMIESFIPEGGGDKHKHKSPGPAYDSAIKSAQIVYHTYKKGRRMIAW